MGLMSLVEACSGRNVMVKGSSGAVGIISPGLTPS